MVLSKNVVAILELNSLDVELRKKTRQVFITVQLRGESVFFVEIVLSGDLFFCVAAVKRFFSTV